jgi:hypothetical protein
MGMFDTYFPRPPLSCPRCGAQLDDFQGKDGPRALFVWLQGVAAPSDQATDDDCKLPVEQREAFRLPAQRSFSVAALFARSASCRTSSRAMFAARSRARFATNEGVPSS